MGRKISISVGRGAAAGGVLFALGWPAQAAADVPASQGFLSFLTQQTLGSQDALQRGIVAALLAGGLIGVIVSMIVILFGARSLWERNRRRR